MRARWLALGIAGAAVAVAVPAAAQDGDTEAPEVDGAEAATATAAVTRRDLEEREELDGTLGYTGSREVSLGRDGTVTALAPLGQVVQPGQALGEVDGRPVVLLQGDRPMWRSLGPDADTADGPDIAQLEANLVALGYGTESALGVNGTWSQATTAAVQRWQDALGVEEDGTVDAGDVVFLPGPVRVAGHAGDVGSPAGSPALTVTGLERLVTVALDADRQGLLVAGQAVEVELPDGSVVAATVRTVGTTVTPGDAMAGTSSTIEVTVAFDDPAASGTLDSAPVEVRLVTVAAEDALTVPVEALLALAEGGYAVERLPASVANGRHGELVGVELGAFAGGFVEVRATTGELAEGDDVVVPA